jgi:hypothetical protein
MDYLIGVVERPAYKDRCWSCNTMQESGNDSMYNNNLLSIPSRLHVVVCDPNRQQQKDVSNLVSIAETKKII